MAFYGPKPIPNLDQLPVELVLLIVEYINSEDDARSVQRTLLALSRVSLRFHRILTSYLYKHNAERRGSSGFKWAIRHRNRGVIKNLFEHGGKITSTESGYPLLLAIKKGDVDILKLLMISASKHDVNEALSQGVDIKRNTVLHWAISFGHVPCVKVLLEAGVNVATPNANEWRPIDCLFEKSQIQHDSWYNQIIALLLEYDPAEMLKPIVDPATLGLIGVTTPLILAATHGSLESVNAIFEHGTGQDLSTYVNEIATTNGDTALAAVCDPSNWPRDHDGADRVLGIVKALLLHGADTNLIDEGLEGGDMLPIYKICLRPPSVDDPHLRLRTVQLQHEIISLLIENDADVKALDDNPESTAENFCGIKFLETAGYYSTYLLDPGKLFLKAEDILEDTHPTLKFDTNPPSSDALDKWNSELKPEEEEKAEILRLLQDMFRKLLIDVEADDFAKYHDRDGRTLLHLAVIIPGPFGFWATQTLLEKGASLETEDRFRKTPLGYAMKNANRVTISLLRRWRKDLRVSRRSVQGNLRE
jgi:ankyrin repeat protein